MQRTFTHSIMLDGRAEALFPLFTAEGERDWVPGWAPHFHHPADEEVTRQGTVWETGAGETRTLWMCIDHDVANHRVRYARVMPSAQFDTVEVTCRDAENGCVVTVTYTFTPLNDAARDEVEAKSQADFAADIDGWKILIEGGQ